MTSDQGKIEGRWLRFGLIGAGGLAAGAVAITQGMRHSDRRDEERVWSALAGRADLSPERFQPAMVEGLPDPARRYFLRAIASGTPLRTVAVITMGGRFGLGTRDEHQFHPMQARQILAPPYGLLWVARFGAGMSQMDGSDSLLDGEAWTRFWVGRLLPVARGGGSGDLARSAVGRLIGEGLWAPASLLPGRGVRWEAVDADTARAFMRVNGEDHAFDLKVAPDGTPLEVSLRRWSNVNPEKVFRWQRFGASFEEVGTFEGFTIPTRVKGGNHYGTAEYFPFFQAKVGLVEFL
jgi:hypothetical protein